MRDPNARQPQKFRGQGSIRYADSQAPGSKSPPIPVELVGALTEDGAPDLKELEKRGMLGTFLRNWNNPVSLKQLKVVSARMRADGIDRKNSAAVGTLKLRWISPRL